MNDRIQRVIELKAPVSRVWQALTNHDEFGEWFRVKLDGPFEVGQVSRGLVTYPGYEGLKWEATVEAMEPEQLFSFTWCPTANEPDVDYSGEPTTLVEFRLESTADGTRLLLSESGFDQIADSDARAEAYRVNSGGWDIQSGNIAAYVER